MVSHITFISAQENTVPEGRAIWAYPANAGKSVESVEEFVVKCKKANIQIIVMLVKNTRGSIFWLSEKFPEAVDPQWKDFDMLEHLVNRAHAYGIRVHAWLCDFTEGKNSPVYRNHPEWAMLNPDGRTTDTEKLGGGRPYNVVWMCPARRPGYTDQWLIPMIEEIVQLYDIDGIHHDYVRYPGDVAPNDYCFCDYCLEDMLNYNHLHYESMPDLFIPIDKVLPKTEANWWSDNTAKPERWTRMNRKRKADFYRKGSYMDDGFRDMNYFFFEYRSDAINRFAQEVWEAAERIKPGIEISAAVFKNPQASGRFIGQRWRDFAPWVTVMMPMSYRSHFQGDFDTFLKMQEEYSHYETKWTRGLTHLYMGITAHYIYKEEYEPLNRIYELLNEAKNGSFKRNWERNIAEEYGKIKNNLENCSPSTNNEISGLLPELSEERPEIINQLYEKIDGIRRDPPEGFYPGEKLIKTIEAVRKGGAEGITIFAATHVENKKLWGALEEAFSEPALPPDKAAPLQTLQITKYSNDKSKIEGLETRALVFQITTIICGIAFLVFLFVFIHVSKKLKRISVS